MNNKYIGVFDSGVGGLTAVKELMSELPDENIVYFGDTGRVPYGSKSNETIIKYALSDINFLKTHDIKLIVVACGTVSSVAIPEIKDKLDVPVIGVVYPTSLKAAKNTKNKKVGIIGTASTISNKKYEEALYRIDKDIKTVSVACPLFVPLAEAGMTDNEAAYLIAKDYLDVFIKEGVDTLILGCTHYPLLKNTIAKVLGSGVMLIDSGEATAEYVNKYLGENNLLSGKRKNEQYKYFVSDSVLGFSEIAKRFLGRSIDNCVKKIDIEKY